MARFYYDHLRRVFAKQCSCCKEVFYGTKTIEESLTAFMKNFASAGPSSGMADGLQSRCTNCNTRSRRALGITRREIEKMWLAQGGKCSICTKEISIVKGAPAAIHAHVDHNDDTGAIRELLCGGCNRGIGSFRHDPQILRAAAEYCAKHENVISLWRFSCE